MNLRSCGEKQGVILTMGLVMDNALFLLAYFVYIGF